MHVQLTSASQLMMLDRSINADSVTVAEIGVTLATPVQILSTLTDPTPLINYLSHVEVTLPFAHWDVQDKANPRSGVICELEQETTTFTLTQANSGSFVSTASGFDVGISAAITSAVYYDVWARSTVKRPNYTLNVRNKAVPECFTVTTLDSNRGTGNLDAHFAAGMRINLHLIFHNAQAM